MNVLNPMSWGTALGAGLIATVALLPQAKGELVYESGTGAQTPAAASNAQIEDRSMMRQSLGASEKVQVTLQTQAATPVEAPTAPLATTPAVETQNMSKAELMRRERQREEIKNEDILQERLEELRLCDERRRTEEVLNAGAAPSGAHAPAQGLTPSAVMKEEVVTAPVTDHPGNPSMAPAMVASTPVDTVVMTQSSVSMAPGPNGVADRSERTMISVAPRAGISNMVGQSGYFQINPHFSAGISALMGTGDNLSFQVGYTFSQYGVSMSSSNPWVIQAQQQAAALSQSTFQSLNMNQNVFDAGVKIHLLGLDSKIRPFVGGGGAYAMSYINFNSAILQQMTAYSGAANISPDYKVNNFLGFLSSGADFKVSKSVFLS